MGKFDRPNYRDRDNRSGFRDKQMHDATCAECGKPCQVPFRPTGDKPIYCSDCFRNHRDDGGRNDRRGGGDRRSHRPNRSSDRGPQLQDQFSKLNAKLDKVIELLSGTNQQIKAEPEKKAKAEKPKKPATKKPATKKAPVKKAKAKKPAAKKKTTKKK